MNINEDFKTVTLTFNRDNKEIKDLLIKFMKETGKSKVDILADALRQYDPDKTSSFNKENLRAVMRELLIEEGLIQAEVSQKQIDEENILSKLNKKEIDTKFLDDDE